MKIAFLIIVLIILTFNHVKCLLTLKFFKNYLKKIDRYPSPEDVDICTKEWIRGLFKRSNT